MNTYYQVNLAVYDNGRVLSDVSEVQEEKKPLNMTVDYTDCREYRFYFDTLREAREFAYG